MHGRVLSGKARRDPERGYQALGRVRQSADLAGSKPAVLKVRLLLRPPSISEHSGLWRNRYTRPAQNRIRKGGGSNPLKPTKSCGWRVWSSCWAHNPANAVRFGGPLPIFTPGSSNRRISGLHPEDEGATPSPGTRHLWRNPWDAPCKIVIFFVGADQG